jgi:glycosyltransferase involved in cell wall biosynthesis
VVINTKNAAETLAKCVESVRWADEILVADMHSLDETVKIASQLQVKVIELPEFGRVEPVDLSSEPVPLTSHRFLAQQHSEQGSFLEHP